MRTKFRLAAHRETVRTRRIFQRTSERTAESEAHQTGLGKGIAHGGNLLDAKAVHKPFRKLGKLLKNFPEPPSPEDVHDIRTQTRRIEAIIGAFQLDNRKSGDKLVKSLKPIRKSAGDVRDMDVLTDFASSLDADSDENCRLQLIEHLAARRTKAAEKLCKKINSIEKQARSGLKQCRRLADADLEAANTRGAKPKDKRKLQKKSAESMASSLQIGQELRDWPKLTEKNIHPFRLKVKELRYVLQLGQNSDSKLIDALGDLKDQIGLWHDWNELSGIAEKVLDHGAGCPMLAQIRSRTRQELDKALQSANALREQYLENEFSGPGKKGAVKEIHPSVVKATARLAS